MINVRLADEHDIRDIFDWRNDKSTRLQSHNSKEIFWEDHENWYKNSLKNKNIYMLICEESIDKSKIGIVRFNIYEDFSIVSINLSPQMKAMGLGFSCLKNSISRFKKDFENIKYLTAEIKIDNIPSIKTFKKVGFILEKESNNINLYKLIL
tara:strand:+ start:1166 stop:1621 length:456 start_codon:yes stop_codon:yes gene_type:complete